MNLRDHFDLKGLVFALFLLAGAFKGDPRLAWLPGDLALLAGGATVALCAKGFVDRRFRVPDRIFWMVVLFVLFTVPLLWTNLLPAYPLDKTQKLFTLTLLAAFAPFFLFADRADVRRFLNALALFGGVMVFEAASRLGAGGSRLAAFDATTIALGRCAGIALLWTAVLLLERRASTLWTLPVVCLATIIMFFSGSRGPFLAALAALAYLGLAFYRSRLKQGLMFGATAAIVGLVLASSADYAPSGSAIRMTRFLSGEVGGSEMTRVYLAQESYALIQRHPAGTGWGGSALELGSSGGQTREYPHNFLLEVTIEAGWAAGLVLTGIFLGGWMRIQRLSGSAEARGVLCMVLFLAANAAVSGDLNDNRLLFCFLAICLGFPEDPPDEATDPAAPPAPLAA